MVYSRESVCVWNAKLRYEEKDTLKRAVRAFSDGQLKSTTTTTAARMVQKETAAHMRSGLYLSMRAHRARPLFQDMVRSVTLTFRYPSVCLWHQLSSLLDRAMDSGIAGLVLKG